MHESCEDGTRIAFDYKIFSNEMQEGGWFPALRV